MDTPDFARAISPVGLAAFDRDYMERAPLHIGRNDARYYESLCSLEELDRFHTIAQPAYTKAFAIDARRKIATDEFANADGRTDALRLFRLFDEGATIVYREVEDHMPALAALCRSAEAHFHTPFVANVYLAPAGGQCFPIHYDARDVFALQISGAKRWRLYRPQRELPLPSEHCYDALPDEGFLEEVELRAGDMLYCPRGFPHIVSAGEEPSLHVSLSTAATTWAELFSHALTEFIARDPAFRAGLPPGFVTAPDEAFEETFALLARRFAGQARAQPALDRLRRQFLAGRSPGAADARQQAQRSRALCAESRIAPRKDVVWRMEQGPEAISLIGLGKEIKFEPSAREALRSALHGPARKVRDLDGGLGVDAMLDLAGTLLANGFVVVEA